MKATARSMSNAKALRRSLSKPEAVLWRMLRGKPSGVRYRRQYPVGPYVADFYCPSARLVIEIDGATHDHSFERDDRRDRYMRRLGLTVVRIAAKDVLADPFAVADGLVVMASAVGPSTTQSVLRGPPPHPVRDGEDKGG